MANYIKLPDGSFFPVKEGEDYVTAMQAAYAKYPEAFGGAPAETQKKRPGFFESIGQGAEQLLSSQRTAFGSLGGGNEAAEAGLKRQKAIAESYGEQPGWKEVTKAYEEKGLPSAIGEYIRQVPNALAQQAPQLAEAAAAARAAGIATKSPYGALAGAFGPSFAQQYGGFLEEQAREQQEKGQPVDVNRFKAAAFAVPAAGLDVATMLIPMGRSIAKAIFGPNIEKLLARGATAEAEKLAAAKLADEGFLKTLGKGTAKGVAFEIPTEVTQQFLQRAQAGQSLFDEDALADYGNTAFEVSKLGLLGGAGRFADKSAARTQIKADDTERDKQTKAAARLQATQEAEALAKDAAELKLALNNVFQGRGDSSMFDTIDNILTNSPITGQLKNIGELKQQLSAYRPLYEKFNKIQQEADDAKHMLTYPVISGEKVFGKPLNDVVNERVKTAIQEGISAGRIPPIPHVDVPNQQLTPQQRMEKFVVENSMYAVTKQLRLEEEAKLFAEIMQKGSDKLVQLGVDPIDVTAIINKLPVKPSEDIYAANRGLNSDIQFNEQVSSKIQAVRDSVKAAQGKVQDKMRDRYDRAIEDVNPLIGYRGQHAGVAGEEHPVGFARYTEHTVDMNGKQLNGRHVHELQSDLAQDVRQLGSKSGSLEKDQAELATLKSKLAEVDELDPTQQIEKAKLNKRISTVEKRISLTSPGKYQLEQPFAGFETSPAVEMQLLIKNAIQSTMRSGQDFVTFPGKESSQAKLYEKVLPNLKQAVKDLGGEKAGFDIKPITLPNPSGDSPTVWGVVWSPDTAAKIMQKGVPFNKGGMVERKTDDNRRYL